jgi:hypothetical protein
MNENDNDIKNPSELATKFFCDFMLTLSKKSFASATKYALMAYDLNNSDVEANTVLGQIFSTLFHRSGEGRSYYGRKAKFHFSMGLWDYITPEFQLALKMCKSKVDGGPTPLIFTSGTSLKKLIEYYPDACFYDTSYNAPRAKDFERVESLSSLSPFTRCGDIPVPGMDDVYSDSVEGVWQGLKIIKGKIDPRYFKGKGRKRKGKPSGHRLGDHSIPYVQARKKIYVPTYQYMLENTDASGIVEILIEKALDHKTQFLFDVNINRNIENTDSPLAHSAVLVDYINRSLFNNEYI